MVKANIMSAVKEASIQREKISRQDDMFPSKVGYSENINVLINYLLIKLQTFFHSVFINLFVLVTTYLGGQFGINYPTVFLKTLKLLE